MSSLILDSLEIHGFKAFRHLQIERLGRVNLIVGKNNVGKTGLLEALRLYAARGNPILLRKLLEDRDEDDYSTDRRSIAFVDGDLAIRHLFYGRRDITKYMEAFEIGPANSKDDMLSISVTWFAEVVDKQGHQQLQPLRPEQRNTFGNPVLGLTIQQPGIHHYLVYKFARSVPTFMKPEAINHVFIPANGLHPGYIEGFWDNIALTDLEDQVLASLRLIMPKIERVNLISSKKADGGRIPVAKIGGFNEPIPLRSLGEGMNRMFGLILALVNAKDGLLLVDEIESGFHYSVQPDLWRLVFEATSRLNVQVFATTHSWDCIKAFQQAAQGDKEESVLISLRRKKGPEDEIVSVLIDEEQLNIVAREQIEVR